MNPLTSRLIPLLINALEIEGPKAIDYLVEKLHENSPEIIAHIKSALEKVGQPK